MKRQTWKLGAGQRNSRSVLECSGRAQRRRSFRAADGFHPGASRGAGESGVALRWPPQSKIVNRLALLLGFILLHSACCLSAVGQSYSVDWYKIAGGGGSSTGGTYSVSGTLGQHDASPPLTGGPYSLTGGFWSLLSVVQTPGAPTLYVSHSGNTVTVFWQNVAGWSLVQNNNLTTPVASWTASSSPTLTGGTNYLNLITPTGSQFFRLAHP